MTLGRVAVGSGKVETGVPAIAVSVRLGDCEASGVSWEGNGRVQAASESTRSRVIRTDIGLAGILTSLN
jgi:hypothetical protein